MFHQDASTNGHLIDILNLSDEIKEESGPVPEWINGYNMNDKPINVERTIPSPD